MSAVLQPWQILVASMAGWIARQQDAVIEYLQEENRVLKQQLGRRRRRLAVRRKAIGRRARAEVASLVTPDTILRWHRQLTAQKWTHKGGDTPAPSSSFDDSAGCCVAITAPLRSQFTRYPPRRRESGVLVIRDLSHGKNALPLGPEHAGWNKWKGHLV